MGASDEDLVLAMQSGDTDSLGTLVLRWEQPLFRFTYRILLRREDARDVCQETFLRILNKCHRYKRGSRFSTWMYQIALNLCRDQLRRRRRWGLLLSQNRELDEGAAAAPVDATTGGDPARQIEKQERTVALVNALKQIPPEQREVLVLKEYEGLKFREIAEILGCPESTVKSRMYYGLSAVRAALMRDGITSP